MATYSQYDQIHRLHSSSKCIASIDYQVMPIQILVGRAEQDRARHIFVFSRPPCRNPSFIQLFAQVTLLSVVAALSCQFGGEYSWRNTVDTDLKSVIGDFAREHAAEMDCGSFCCTIREMMLSAFDHAGDGRDVDHRSGVAMVSFSGVLEQW